MTTPATAILLNLSSNIGANTLTALQQSALQQALVNIAPTFPGPDNASNGLTDGDESLAREWIAALYAITLGVGGAVSGIPARAFATNAAPVLPGAAIAIGATVTVTPGITGKMKVRISGVIENNDSSAASHPFTLSVNTGVAAAGAQLFTQDTLHPAGAANPNPGTDCFSLVVDLDKLATPFVAPVGTPLQINANVLGSGSAALNIATGGLQLEVEEATA
jgi:hypothetical protein